MNVEETWANQLNAIHTAETKRQTVPLHIRLPHLREELALWKEKLLQALEEKNHIAIKKHSFKIIQVHTELFRATIEDLRKNPLYTAGKEQKLLSTYQEECTVLLISLKSWLISS